MRCNDRTLSVPYWGGDSGPRSDSMLVTARVADFAPSVARLFLKGAAQTPRHVVLSARPHRLDLDAVALTPSENSDVTSNAVETRNRPTVTVTDRRCLPATRPSSIQVLSSTIYRPRRVGGPANRQTVPAAFTFAWKKGCGILCVRLSPYSINSDVTSNQTCQACLPTDTPTSSPTKPN